MGGAGAVDLGVHAVAQRGLSSYKADERTALNGILYVLQTDACLRGLAFGAPPKQGLVTMFTGW
ncbi:hypothetical protein CI15_15585 [Paraburkholderia monticola]|uniref:Uncharacterized protein n=1 Tax=Paraburkholderia monticola TaxID=1399968 RepID=A0A149PR59_9BURK|nr:hypothetical protein CI15_15585 [Paraburkholderia monticola]